MDVAGLRHRARPAARGLTALVALAPLVLWAAASTVPQYDTQFHLVWGRMLLDGELPDVEAYAAPTQHPLWIAVGALLPSERGLVLLCLLSLSALIVAVHALAERLFGALPAAAAALFVGSSFALVLLGVRAYLDLPFLALVLWAAVLAAPSTAKADRTGTRTVPGTSDKGPGTVRVGVRVVGVAGLLALAGLLRPEAWVLAAGWWLWRVRDPALGMVGRLALTALAAIGPLGWMATDLALTGDPLFSLTNTSDLAEALGRERGIENVPRLLVTLLFDVARAPVALLGVVGAVLAVRRFGWRAMAVPLALLGVGVGAFVGVGIFGLSLIPRYLNLPAVALCLFAGYALAGWTLESDPPRWWPRASAVAVVLGLAFLVVQLPSFATLRSELSFLERSHRDVAALLGDPRVAAARRCGPISFPTYRLVPDARFQLDVGSDAVLARSDPRGAPRRGVAITVARDTKAEERYAEADGVPRSTKPAPPGFRPVARRGDFTAAARCPARSG